MDEKVVRDELQRHIVMEEMLQVAKVLPDISSDLDKESNWAVDVVSNLKKDKIKAALIEEVRADERKQARTELLVFTGKEIPDVPVYEEAPVADTIAQLHQCVAEEEKKQIKEMLLEVHNEEFPDLEDEGISRAKAEDILEDEIERLREEENGGMIQSMRDSLYQKALDIISDHQLCNILPGENHGLVWRFDGRIYNPMRSENILQLVYDSMSAKEKLEHNKIETYIKNVANFIFREVASMNKKGTDSQFTLLDYVKIQNHIVFRNGIYDILTGELSPHTGELPYYCGVDAEFQEDSSKSPTFEKLKFCATGGDKEFMEMLDIVTGALFLNRQLKHIFVAGSASNSGKSKFIEFIERLMPKERVSRLDPADLNNKFALGDADAITLFSCSDMEMDFIQPKVASKLKRLTGDRYIRGEAKFQQARDVFVLGKVLLGTNGRFATKKSDSGLTNRLVVLPFINSVAPENQNQMLLEKLWDERNEIMSTCAMQLNKFAEKEGRFWIPESGLSRKIKEEWNSCLDFSEAFMEERVEITGDKNDNLDMEEVYKRYSEFYNECFIKAGTEQCCKLNKKELQESMYRLSGGRIERKRVSYVGGVRQKNAVWRICGLRIRSE